MLLFFFAVFFGLGLLIWGADRFVDSAAASALHLGMSPMMIGLTIVAFGTSAPEILVSAVAAWEQAPSLAVGNAIGSNIANIALVLGATAIIAPLHVRSSLLRVELPILALASIFTGIVLLDLHLGRTDGIILLIGLVVTLLLLNKYQQQSTYDSPSIPALTLRKSFVWLLIGILMLAAGSKLLVWGGTNIALVLGVSDLIIGLTIVAIGTSLPELAASILSARKGQHEMAIGNIIGSNIFNLLAVLAVPGIIYPADIAISILWRDYGLMLALTALLYSICMNSRKSGMIGRNKGTLLLLVYTMYLLALYYVAQV